MQSIDASVVIAPYLESVVRGRRVAVLGDATLALGQALLDRGARLVHVYDPDASRVAEVLASRGVSRTLVTAPLPEGDLAVRDGAFDVVVVPNLAVVEPVGSIVARARRLVAAHGYAVFVSPNADALPGTQEKLLTYYEMYDAVALQFPEVRMLGQAPFSGYVIADFAPDGDPEVVVDTSLMEREDRAPRWFVALGTQRPQRLDPFTIVQIPQGLEEAAVDARVVARLHEQVDFLERMLEDAQASAATVVRPVAPVALLDDRVDALEASLREREEELRRVELRAGDNHVRAGQLENKVRDLEEDLRSQRDRAFRLSNDLEEEKKYRTKADLELRMVRSRPEMPSPQDAARLAELDRLRVALSQVETKNTAMESDLATAKLRLADSQRDLAASKDALDDTLVAKKQADERVGVLQRQVTERDARIAQLDIAVVSLQETVRDPKLERDLTMARQAHDELQASYDASLAGKLKEVARLVRERDEARRCVEQTRRDMDRLLASVAQERDAARSSLQVSRGKVDELEVVADGLRQQLNSLQANRHEEFEQAMKNAVREKEQAVALVEASAAAAQADHEQDVKGFEQTLHERGQEIRNLRAVVEHHERMVRELVQRLDGVVSDGDVVPVGVPDVAVNVSAIPLTDVCASADLVLRERMQVLLAEAAMREGELQQARWRIAELEQRSRDLVRGESEEDASDLEGALFAAHNELDVMRQALAAEREAHRSAGAVVQEDVAATERRPYIASVPIVVLTEEKAKQGEHS